MNKDLDERLIPNGEYRDALNLDLANSEGANIGTLQNVKGNREQRGCEGCSENWSADYIDALQDPVVIGSIRHDETERIYWFIAAPTKTGSFPYGVSAIAEYDQTTDLVKPVLVDTAGILKFSQDYLITGINILDKFLFWTDDQTEPKKINIEKFKTGSVDFTTHTKIPFYNQTSETYSTALTGQPDFTEEDVTVIKKSPLSAPTLDMAASKFGSDIPGTGITPVTTQYTSSGLENFTYIPDTVNAGGDTESMPTHGEYDDNIAENPNYYQDSNLPANFSEGIDIVLSAPVQGDDLTVWNSGDIIILKGSYTNEYNESYSYQIRALIVFASNIVARIKILAISADIQVFENPITWEALLEEKEPLFEYVFPRFAYRWKYIDNEYSVFSPFTEVAFIGSEFQYLSTDGYNGGMSNNIRKLIIEDLTWGSEEVVEIDILYKASDSQAVYTVETIKRNDYTNLDGSLNNSFEITSEIFGAVIQSNQILRPWDNVPRKAKAQEIIGNRVVYANYLQNYNVPTIAINAKAFSQPHPDQDSNNTTNNAEKSIKSIRKYQTGIVFKDEFGRETPVVTDKTAGVEFPIETSDNINKIQVQPSGDAPDWATHYKVFIKDISNEYYNLALDRFYQAEDGNVWLSFPSSERNKITEDSYLILKKQHATSKAVDNLLKYKILSIAPEAPTFLTRRRKAVARATVSLTQASQPQQDSVFFKFNGPSASSDPNFAQGFTSNASLRISSGSYSTDTYEIQSGGPTGQGNIYSVALSEPLGNEAFWLNDLDAGAEITIVLFEEEDKILPEYSGRFFVKINRDYGFETNIIDTFPTAATEYGIKDSFRIQPEHYQNHRDVEQNVVWRDNGHTRRERPWGHTCPWKYPGECSDNKKLTIILQGLYIEDANNSTKWVGGALADLDKVGTLIRFADSEGNVGKIYTIAETSRRFRRRGLRSSHGGYTNYGNGANDWLITLEEPYEDFDIFTNRVGANPISEVQILEKVFTDDNKTLSSFNPAIFETEPREAIDLDIYYEASNAKPISEFNNLLSLDYHNVFSFGNGVESNRIRDDFNAVTIDKGVKASSIIDGPYSEERRGNGFIFSQIYNSTSGINRLNQFIQAEPITKDLNPIHGTIQKLHARDTDLITLCEDKCFRVLANKDALYNADGNVNLTGNNAVLGQAVPYAGEFGISKNPESFASYGFRVYFSDKNRGAVIRLSRDGITEISSKGMSDFFENNLRVSNNIIGSYDSEKGLYNITLDTLSKEWQNTLSEDRDYQLTPECNTDATSPVTQTTISFKEEVDGWTSRKSFIQESGVSLNNRYYTFKNGLIWEHGLNVLANNFYSVQYDSSFNVVINEMPQSVKGFSTLNYTGTQSRLLEYWGGSRWYSIAEINASQLIPTAVQQKQPGWYVNYVKTDLEGGEIKEFQKKEGKKFNYIKALEIFNDCEIIGDGIGPPVIVECDPQSYNFTITIDEECSSTGDGPATGPPDKAANMWYRFVLTKPPTTYSIPLQTSANNVVCTVNEFYEAVNGNYAGQISNVSARGMKWHSSAGLNVGTQMYDFTTEQPLNYATGYYIFLGEGVSTTGLDPNYPHSGPGSGALNDNTLIIKLTNGVITEVTQYNTITPTC
jgi:hypothetical protein